MLMATFQQKYENNPCEKQNLVKMYMQTLVILNSQFLNSSLISGNTALEI